MDYRNIGSRLLMAASLVEKGKIVCDVGCDHGKLSLYLIKENKACHVIATDINKSPLEKAIRLFKENELEEKADFLHTDGLTGIEKVQDITHVVIAGLGGETMAKIIQEAEFIKQNKVKLVLIPAQSGAKIRRFLLENGFDIFQENTVGENKKFYTAISAVYTGQTIAPTVYDCYIGKAGDCTDKSATGYFKMVLSQLEKQQAGQIIDNGSCDKEIENAIIKIKELIKSI